MILFLLLAGLSAQAAYAQFDPVHARFQDFEQNCRLEYDMEPKCAQEITLDYQTRSSETNIKCDWRAFWIVRDLIYKVDVLSALPWKTAVVSIFEVDGVCWAE